MKCFYIKLKHVTKPNRALLESIKDQWISENGKQPDGNDNGEQQNIWENPLDCKPLMLGQQLSLLQSSQSYSVRAVSILSAREEIALCYSCSIALLTGALFQNDLRLQKFKLFPQRTRDSCYKKQHLALLLVRYSKMWLGE